MSATEAAEVRRLLLALDASRCCPQDVELAVELAALIGGELEGLFVEDVDLMNLAQLPFAREVGGSSGQHRPLVRESIESLVRRRVERAIGELERAAKRRNVAVKHTTTRGKVVQQALAQGERQNVLLLHPRSPMAAAPLHGMPRPIMVWYEDPEAAASALDIAVELARMLRAELLVGVPVGQLGAEREVRASLANRMVRLSGRVRVTPVAGAHAEALMVAARAAKVAQLVLAATGEFATEAVIDTMLSGLGSKLVLVR